MFKGLKNKIREETGSDVSKISPLVGGSSQKPGAFKGRHSRQGSTSSIGSVSVDGIREENSQSPAPSESGADITQEDLKSLSQKDVKLIEKREEEWKRKLNKLEIEWKRKLEDKEKQWKKQLETKEEEKALKEKSVEELQKSLLLAEGSKSFFSTNVSELNFSLSVKHCFATDFFSPCIFQNLKKNIADSKKKKNN